MATTIKPTAKAEATPKAKRTKTPPPTLAECAEAVKVRRDGLTQFSALIVQLDNIAARRVVPNDWATIDAMLKVNAKARRSVKASIRRANKVIQRYEKSISTAR